MTSPSRPPTSPCRGCRGQNLLVSKANFDRLVRDAARASNLAGKLADAQAENARLRLQVSRLQALTLGGPHP